MYIQSVSNNAHTHRVQRPNSRSNTKYNHSGSLEAVKIKNFMENILLGYLQFSVHIILFLAVLLLVLLRKNILVTHKKELKRTINKTYIE
jgi:hypothetical protein